MLAKRRYRADHEATRRGRRRHAARQARYRLRRQLLRVGMAIVTDHPSAIGRVEDILGASGVGPGDVERGVVDAEATDGKGICDFCGRLCGPWVHEWSMW